MASKKPKDLIVPPVRIDADQDRQLCRDYAMSDERTLADYVRVKLGLQKKRRKPRTRKTS